VLYLKGKPYLQKIDCDKYFSIGASTLGTQDLISLSVILVTFSIMIVSVTILSRALKSAKSCSLPSSGAQVLRDHSPGDIKHHYDFST